MIAIADGDTITVLDENRTQHKVRLAGIDAPEKGQPFGQRSRRHLSDLVYRKAAVVDWQKRDRYGRIVGKVLVDGVDVDLEQVRAGMAWWFRKYAHEQTSEDQSAYRDAEEEAKMSRRGLWSEPEPVAPWDWREGTRSTPSQPSAQEAVGRGGCDPAYPDICIPSPPPDLDCGDVPVGRFRVLPPDPHRFDGDGNGIGCEK